MSSPISWLSDTFNADSAENDIIQSRSLNITRIGGVVVPVLTGIWTAISELAEIAPFNDIEFQKTLILALVLFVGALSVADIFGRAISSRRGAGDEGVVTFASSIAASKAQTGADLPGRVIAYRGATDSLATGQGEFLFIPSEGEPSWEPAQNLILGTG